VLGAVGVALLGGLVAHLGVEPVTTALVRAAPAALVVLALEGLILLCDAAALRALHAPDPPPWRAIGRATLVGYPIASLAPAGRAFAEGVRATMLAPSSGQARAATAAGRVQGVVLLSAGVASLAGAIGAAARAWPAAATGAMLANAALTFGLGFGVLAGGRHLKLGARLGRLFGRAGAVGAEVDALWGDAPLVPWRALAFLVAGRAVVVLEVGVVLAALGVTDPLAALAATGVLLVGTSVGDLVPAQAGVTEVHFALAASALGLAAGDAVVVPMLVRLAQLGWSALGFIAPLWWRPEVST
jgi:hypothetical protein